MTTLGMLMPQICAGPWEDAERNAINTKIAVVSRLVINYT